MKAFLLAAGVGSGLRPVTDSTPKCLLTIGGRPMLDFWLDALGAAGVGEVLVNLHHLAEVVRAHLAGRTAGPLVRTFFEPELLGSAGTLAANRGWVADEDFFLACHADNLTDFDLRSLIEAHREHRPAATLAVFRAENPSAGGIVELDSGGWVTGFEEKPARPKSDLANAGIYAFDPAVLDEIGTTGPTETGTTGITGPVDIGYHLLPGLVGRARAVPVRGYFRDIGTPEAYRLAGQEWRARTLT